jgi:hypothetical protein
MIKLIAAAALTLTTLIQAMPAQAALCRYCSSNGVALNGITLNGAQANGMTGVSVLAVTLPSVIAK